MTTTGDIDPTRIDIETDRSNPEQARMKGYAFHGDTPFDVPFISEIVPGLWQGGCETGLVLPRRIKHLVSLYPWERYTVNHQLASETYVRMLDSTDQGFDQVRAIASWVNTMRDTGQNVLVHCQAGLNRSSLVAATALVLNGDVESGSDAINLVRDKRSPACLCNPSFSEWVGQL